MSLYNQLSYLPLISVSYNHNILIVFIGLSKFVSSRGRLSCVLFTMYSVSSTFTLRLKILHTYGLNCTSLFIYVFHFSLLRDLLLFLFSLPTERRNIPNVSRTSLTKDPFLLSVPYLQVEYVNIRIRLPLLSYSVVSDNNSLESLIGFDPKSTFIGIPRRCIVGRKSKDLCF